MKLWQMLVLAICCGCSLDTAPDERADAGAATPLQPVSFGAWRRLLAAADGEHSARAGSMDAGGREPVALDAGACDARAHACAPRAADPEHPRPNTPAGPAAMGGMGTTPAEASAADGGTEPSDAGREDPTSDPGMAPRLDTPTTRDAGPPETTGTTGPATVTESEPSTSDTEAHTARVAQRLRLLGLVQTTIDNAFGLIWTAESGDITSTAAALAAGPEDVVTRPAVAGLLIRLSRTSGCRSDNPRECTELCVALESDCTVCSADDACQSAVEHMCAPQSHFHCSP